MKRFLQSFYKSLSQAFAGNEYIIRLKERHPKLVLFVRRRISLTDSKGLWFTVGIILSVISLFYFLGLAQDILAHDSFVQADVRVMNLIADFRDLSVAKIILLFTYLGSWPTIVSFGAVVLFILFLLDEKRRALFFVLSVVIAEGTYSILKLIIHRTRPNIGYSLTPREGFSFPSGHATISVVFYGLLGYIIYTACKKWWQKLLVIAATLGTIFLTGFSRIYLGVHWSSDVLAGWAVGFTILIFAITLLVEQERFAPNKERKTFLPRKTIAAITVILLLVEVAFTGYYYKTHPLVPTILPSAAQEKKIALPSLDSLFAVMPSSQFPKFSETIVGDKMEPISLIVTASFNDINQAFEKAGWFVAERGVGRLPQLAVAAFFNQPYSTAPVTPSFLNAKPEIVAFEKPTDLNTVRQRHHARFWLTNYSVNGVPVWVATASFDDGLRYLITHEIRPDIDTERDFIKSEFMKAGLVKNIQEIQLVPRLMGTNQSGDQFFTDGKAYVIELSGN